ncbi:rhomboid family intramembrane serine protease [Marihabitans asiaticum]|uniref:Membrane associated rhomboid family serine protease n=1 Tax=Marihabitans asiaticum TaxID=415218 RepID=A0A560WG26_9MICO|nr:rhomboid family intramembrane serine protease [Marihabitans asiaticum]TWD16627.1 membrane associated rhomboid family serine protease [Marihabitans asiaticum]
MSWDRPTEATEAPVCPRHPDRVSYVRCQRCQRPACPDCQRPAAVGIQCVDCVREAERAMPRERTPGGGRAARSGTPVVTIAIMVICGLVYLGELTTDQVYREGALAAFIATSEPWRLLTSAFLHAPNQIFHIMFNMLALWIVGPQLEMWLGRARFLGLYLVSALAGSVTYLLFQPVDSTQGVVGASGAVFGLFGAIVVVQRHLGRDASSMLGVIGINAVIGFVIPNIAWQAHLGGLVAGAALAALLSRPRQRDNPTVAWAGIAAVAVLSLALFALKFVVLA